MVLWVVGVGFENTCTVSGKVTYKDDPRLNPMGKQFLIPVLLNLRSESVQAQNFEILVEDSGTGGPSSLTIRMEHLFAFQF